MPGASRPLSFSVMQPGARAVWWGSALAIAFGWAAVTCRPSASSSDGSTPPETLLPISTAPLEGWGLVGLPRGGGTAAYRSLPALQPGVWSSAAELPRADEVVGGAQGAAILSARGEVSWFGLTGGRVERLGRARGAGIAGLGTAPGAAVVLDTATREVAVLGGDAVWKVVADGVPVWADWVEEHRLAVYSVPDRGRPTLTLYKPPLKTVLRRLSLDFTGPPVVTAWGAVLYAPGKDPNGRSALLALSAADLSQTGAIPLPSDVHAVVATPSGHRLYAASADARIYVADRVGARLLRTVALPAPTDRFRFNRTGEILLARIADADSVAVLLAGVDRLAGLLPARWDANLPWASPGGRYVVLSSGSTLRVFEAPELRLLAEAPDDSRLWWPVAWVPPERRPTTTARGIEPEAVRRDSASATLRAAPPVATAGAADTALSPPPPPPSGGERARAGIYAVVSAARTPEGIRELSTQLAVEGYPASVDRYVDEMGTVWYRAMIGPYGDRPAAEAAAGRVAGQRGVRPWILEIRPPAPSSPR